MTSSLSSQELRPVCRRRLNQRTVVYVPWLMFDSVDYSVDSESWGVAPSRLKWGYDRTGGHARIVNVNYLSVALCQWSSFIHRLSFVLEARLSFWTQKQDRNMKAVRWMARDHLMYVPQNYNDFTTAYVGKRVRAHVNQERMCAGVNWLFKCNRNKNTNFTACYESFDIVPWDGHCPLSYWILVKISFFSRWYGVHGIQP